MATVTVEERIARIEERMDTFATKADLHQLETRLIKWIIGAQLGFIIAISGLLVAYAQLFGGS